MMEAAVVIPRTSTTDDPKQSVIVTLPLLRSSGNRTGKSKTSHSARRNRVCCRCSSDDMRAPKVDVPARFWHDLYLGRAMAGSPSEGRLRDLTMVRTTLLALLSFSPWNPLVGCLSCRERSERDDEDIPATRIAQSFVCFTSWNRCDDVAMFVIWSDDDALVLC